MTVSGWRWLTKDEVLILHERQIAVHGGPSGLRDEGLLESALARPENLFAYGDPDVAELAAAYAYGLARNHAFIDGNKRASFVACTLFLFLNGQSLPAADDANIATWLALASGALPEPALAAWLRSRLRPLR